MRGMGEKERKVKGEEERERESKRRDNLVPMVSQRIGV